MNWKRLSLVIIGGLAVFAIGWRVGSSARVQEWWTNLRREPLPVAEDAADVIVNRVLQNTNISANTNAAPVTVPSQKNLNVPFTSQAPDANWDQDHEEFCEEASVIMVGRYYQGRTFTSTADAEQALQKVKQWQLDNLGSYYDTTAAETAQIIEGVYDLKVRLIRTPTLTDIKRELAAGHPLIIPTAGRELGNPNFTAPGPIYHMLVIRGYTADGQLITNDPGTRKGKEYLYDPNVVLNAMHDWVSSGDRKIPGNGTPSGSAVMLVVEPAT